MNGDGTTDDEGRRPALLHFLLTLGGTRDPQGPLSDPLLVNGNPRCGSMPPAEKKVTEPEAQVSYSAEFPERGAAPWGSNRPGSANRIGNWRWAWQRLVCSKVGHDRRARGRGAFITI